MNLTLTLKPEDLQDRKGVQYEFTGETRVPKVGERYWGMWVSVWTECHKDLEVEFPILRKVREEK